LLAYQPADIWGGPTDKEIQNGKGKMRIWVKAMYMTESTYHKETFLPQWQTDTIKACF
jgi:hypothetical protein